LKIDDERRESICSQRGRAKDRALETMRSIFREDLARRPGRVCKVIRHGVKQLLNAVRIFQAAQLAQFLRSEAEVVVVHREQNECSVAWDGLRLADEVRGSAASLPAVAKACPELVEAASRPPRGGLYGSQERTCFTFNNIAIR